MNTFGGYFYNGTTTLKESHKDHSDLLIEIMNLKKHKTA